MLGCIHQYLIDIIIITIIVLLNSSPLTDIAFIYTMHSLVNKCLGCFQFCGIKIQNKEDSTRRLGIWSNSRRFFFHHTEGVDFNYCLSDFE